LAFGGRFVKTSEDIGNIVVGSSLGNPVFIHDLGTVRLTNEWKRKDSSLNGKSCVGLDVYYQGGIDQKKVADAVAMKVSEIIRKNKGIHYRSWDLNEFTDAATNAVLLDLVVGMLIIALVTFIFLRNFKYSLVALLSMPLAACLTFLIMSALGMSINLMTLGGLTAAIGLVVDNTVIILEMYHHRKSIETRKSRIQLLHETLVAVAKPMIFGTATIALVFTPISYLSGVSGMFFAPMAHVHTSALIVSVFLALFMVPGLILLFDRSKKHYDNSDHGDFDEGKLAKSYKIILQWVLKRGNIATSFFLLIPLIGLFALPFAQTGFLPEWDEGDIVIDFRAITPLGLEATIERIKPVEEFLNKEVPEINFFIRKVGTGLGSYNKPPFVGEVVVKLKKDRQRSVFQIIEDIGTKLEKLAPDLEFDLFQILPDRLNDLSGSAKPIVIHLRGDGNKLEHAAQEYKNALSQIKGLASVRINEPAKAKEYQLNINESITRALELNPNMIDADVRFAIFSLDSSFIQNGQQTIPIRLRSKVEKKVKSSQIDLEDIPTFSKVGGLKKVRDIGKVNIIKSRVESEHIDGAPVRTITAELSGTDLGSAVRKIKKKLANINISGVYTELAGDFAMQQRSFRQLIQAFLTGIALIFITSLFFSNRLKVAIPLTAVSLIPPVVGLVGCVVFNISLDVSSFSGLISVTGIAVANSFMALYAIEDLPEFHRDYKEAVIKGMISRLRPILMTNLAAMAGFAPIAIGLAQGDEILRPFSIAVIVGLLGAIYTTLVVMPTFYFHFSKQKIG
jgi:multidrug efflux pump subunit AcrB